MRFKFLDGLRAVAILLVVAFHTGIHIIPGQLGVNLFFVISGFVITRLLIREYAATTKFWAAGFYARRALKILPPFFVTITLGTLITWRSSYSTNAVLAQHFFMFNWVSEYGPADVSNHILRGSGVVWSLSVEEQFYIAIAIVWLLLTKFSHAPIRRLEQILLATFAISTLEKIGIALLAPKSADALQHLRWSTDCRISGIALGGLIAIYYARSTTGSTNLLFDTLMRQPKRALFAGLTALSISFLFQTIFLRSTIGYIVQDLGAGLVVIAGLNQSGAISWVHKFTNLKPVQYIGLASYSIYLSHMIAMEYLLSPQSLYTLSTSPVPRTLELFLIPIAIGLIIHQLVDAPMEKYRKRWRIQTQEIEQNFTSAN